LRERVSEILTFFLIFSFCLFFYILVRIWDNATRIILTDVKVLTDDPTVERFVKNSLLLWEKPVMRYLGEIKELDTYLEKLDMRVENGNLRITVKVRKPIVCVQMRKDGNRYLLVSKDGYILEMNESAIFEGFPVLYGVDERSKKDLRIVDPDVIKFLRRFSKLDARTLDLLSSLDYEKMLVYMRKGIIMKVNNWSNFFDNVGMLEEIVRILPRGTMIQLLSGGRLLLLSRER